MSDLHSSTSVAATGRGSKLPATADDGGESIEPPDDQDPGATVDRPRSTRRELGVAAAVLAVVAIGLVLTIVTHGTKFSIYDEATHVDYAWKISHGHVPRGGEQFAEWTRETWSCHGQVMFQAGVPACGSDAPAHAYPGFGLNYNYFHPPLYYATTGGAALLLSKMTGNEFFTMARSLGALWLFAAMLAMYLTLRYWRVPFGYALTGALSLAAFEMVVHLDAFVTNDAAAALCGVGALFILGRNVIYQRQGSVLPATLAALAAATKTMNALAFLIVGIVILSLGVIEWRQSGFKAAIPKLRVGLTTGVSVLAVHIAWTQIQAARTPPGYLSPVANQNTDPIMGLPFDEWAPTLPAGFRLGAGMYLDPVVDSPYLGAWTIVLTTLVAAASLLCLAVFRRSSPRWIVGCTLLAGCLIYPLLVQIQTLISSDAFFPVLTERYGLSLVPFAVACLTFVAQARGLRRTFRVFVGAGLVVITLSSLGFLS